MGARRVLSIGDRVEIATGLKAGWSIRAIVAAIGRAPSVVSREVRRNRTKTRGYQVVHADVKAERRRARPQARKVALDPVLAARVDADLRHSRTPRQISGRLTLEATDSTVELMNGSPPAEGRTCFAFGIQLSRESLRGQCGLELTVRGQPQAPDRPRGWVLLPPGHGRFVAPAHECPVHEAVIKVHMEAGSVAYGVAHAGHAAATGFVVGDSVAQVSDRLAKTETWWRRECSWE